MNLPRSTVAALLALSIGACAPSADTTAESAPVAPNVVTYTALDFAFDGPAEIPAGPTTFRLVASGKEIHHLSLVKLEDGKTFDSLMAAFAAMKGPGPMPGWMVFVGGPNAPAPGLESNATVNLEPGNYALLCFVDTPDKVPHIMKGMSRALTVSGDAPANVAVPAPTVTITMSDYAFAPDIPLTAGKQTIKVVNTGMEPHELVLVRLEDGKTMADMAVWAQSLAGPPPGVPMGGASPTAKGKDMQFDVDLVAGNYLLLCFLPDPTGAKLHLDHGMVLPFTIQ